MLLAVAVGSRGTMRLPAEDLPEEGDNDDEKVDARRRHVRRLRRGAR